MNTRSLEYILAIAEEHSMTRAAERFYLSHPALSRHLKNIEEELGCPLFRRTREGLQLTPEGAVFISDARAILHLEEQLIRSLSAMRQQQRHSISVMVDAPFYNRFVQRVIPRFTAQEPQFTLDITRCNASEASAALRDGRAVLAAFMTSSAQAPDLNFVPFYRTEMRLVFPKDHRGRTDIEGLREALASGMYLSQYPSGSTTQMLIRQRLAVLQIHPARTMEGESRTIVEHVIAGNACCILPAFFRRRAEQAGLVVGDVFSPVMHVLAYPARVPLSAAVQELMQIIIDVFSDFEDRPGT